MDVQDQAKHFAQRLGRLVRAHREAAGLRLEDLAAAAGVGIRFLHELETGKPSCQLGRALVVAASLGLDPIGLLEVAKPASNLATARR